jgi:hypothetical protein
MRQDPEQLKDELTRRNLVACGGTVFAGLHKSQDALDKAIADFGREAKLLAGGGCRVPRAPSREVHRHAHRPGHPGR